MMTIDPVCATPDTPLGEIATMMVEHHCGAIPIISDGRITGIVTDRDITCRTLPRDINPLTCKAGSVMTGDVLTISEDERAESAARTMERAHVRRLPVVDSEERIVGIVSATDLAMKAQEIASGLLFPKVAHHVPAKTSARYVTWL